MLYFYPHKPFMFMEQLQECICISLLFTKGKIGLPRVRVNST